MNRVLEVICNGAAITLALCVGAAGQVSQEKLSSEPLQALNASLGQLSAKVTPAVVHIRVASYRSDDEHEGRDDRSEALVKQRGAGSGVIVDPEGYIVTALHLVEGERRIRVELNNRAISKSLSGQVDTRKPRSFYDGKIVGSFKEADLAVLKIDAGELPYLLFSEPETLKQGQLVAALGNPEGLRDSLSLGVISSVSQQIEPDDSMAYIQTDAALAPGNSGGPLVDVQGGIVGINVFSVTDRGKDERLGFAVPGEMVRFAYEQIRQYGCVPRANLGVDLQGVTPTLASALHLPADSGVIVSSVPPGTPASKSLQTGDVILSFAGTHVESLPQLNWALLHRRAGQHVPLEVSRNHNKTALKLVLVGGTPDSVDDLAATDIEENSLDKLGVVGSSFKRGANEPHSKEAPSGVLVTARLSGTDAQPELEVGDVIRSLNGISITSVAPLRAMVDSFKPGDAVALQIERKGRLMYVAFEID